MCISYKQALSWLPGTRTKNELWSRNECYLRSSRGRVCAHDYFVAKVSAMGL